MARAWLRLFALAMLAVGVASATSAATDPLAVIASVKGRVEVVAAGAREPERAVFGRGLAAGDRVQVGAGGAASLFFGDGSLVELAEKSSLTLGAKGTVGARGKATGVGGEVYASVTRFVAGGSRGSGLVAVSDMRGADTGAAMLLAPRHATVRTGRPEFRWRAYPGATRYRLTLTAGGGELWSKDLDAASLPAADGVVSDPYPGDEAPLAPDTDQVVRVEALSDLATLRDESSLFHVAPAAAAAAIDANLTRLVAGAGGADTPAARFLAGSYLSGLGLYHDAADEFAALARLTPDSPAPHEALGDIYSKVGLMDLAAAEYQQALALGRAAH